MNQNYCSKGKELLLDLKRSDWLPSFDDEAVRSILFEANQIMNEFDSLSRGGKGNIATEMKAKAAFCICCLKRNHQYIFWHRTEKIRALRWEIGPVLPEKIAQEKLSLKENEYFTNYNEILNEFIESYGFDVTGDIEPPKDLLIQIRVLESCGTVMTESGPVALEKGSIFFLKRSEVETFIREGKIEPIETDSEC